MLTLDFIVVIYFIRHNETTNIWSHLIGFSWAIYATIVYAIDNIFKSELPLGNSNDRIQFKAHECLCFGVFILSASLCLLFSTIYHWFNCLSPTHHNKLLLLDLTGIALLVGSSYLPAIYFGFYCMPNLQAIYLGFSVVVLAVGLIAPWIEIKINGIMIRPFVFATLVASGIVPSIHWYLISPPIYRDQVVLGFIGMFFWYAVGFVFFMRNFPESHFPKR
jgi:adiponectin receptor